MSYLNRPKLILFFESCDFFNLKIIPNCTSHTPNYYSSFMKLQILVFFFHARGGDQTYDLFIPPIIKSPTQTHCYPYIP